MSYKLFKNFNQFLGERYSQHMVAFPAPNTTDPLPLSALQNNKNILYVHIPFCTGKCTYCSYVTKTVDQNSAEITSYLTYLQKEASLLTVNQKPVINSIYIGGGTPSMLSINQLDFLFSILEQNFDLTHLEEYTLEGCPETFSIDKAQFAITKGITRASIGVESFDDDILLKMNRRHNSLTAIKAVNDILSTGLDLDIDIITCYPGYTEDKIKNDIKVIKNIKPTSVSTYKYTVKPNSIDFKNHQHLLSRKEVLQQTLLWYKGLKDIGYSQRNVDWFFINSEKRFLHQDYKLSCEANHIVLGVSGYGILGDTQYYNTKIINTYKKLLDINTLPVESKQKLNSLQLEKRKIMFGIRGNITSNYIFPEPEKIDWLLEKELITKSKDYYTLTDVGQIFINEIQEYLVRT